MSEKTKKPKKKVKNTTKKTGKEKSTPEPTPASSPTSTSPAEDESRLLADLQRDLDDLNQEADLVNTYAQRVEECGGEYKELLRLIPTVNDIVNRPFKRHFDMPEVRIPREAYDCARALDDIESAESALRAKDHMIWKLMKERKDDKDQVQIAQSESHTIGERSAQEIAKWKKMSNEFLEKFEQCDEELYHAQNRVKEEQDRLVRFAEMILRDDMEQAKSFAEDIWTERYPRRPVPSSRRSSSSSRQRRRFRKVNSSEMLDEDDDELVEEDLNATELNKNGAIEKDEDHIENDISPKSTNTASAVREQNIRMVPSSPEISDLGFELDAGASRRRRPYVRNFSRARAGDSKKR